MGISVHTWEFYIKQDINNEKTDEAKSKLKGAYDELKDFLESGQNHFNEYHKGKLDDDTKCFKETKENQIFVSLPVNGVGMLAEIEYNGNNSLKIKSYVPDVIDSGWPGLLHLITSVDNKVKDLDSIDQKNYSFKINV